MQSEVGVWNFATVENRKINIYFTGLQIILIGGQIQAALSSTPTHLKKLPCRRHHGDQLKHLRYPDTCSKRDVA